MKARIPLSKTVKKAVLEYNQEQQMEVMRRFLKLACVSLHDRFGFGNQRLEGFLSYFSRLAEESQQDEIFWRHTDRVVMKELGLDFKPENYEELEG
jgi:UDP-N-acetylglucosamine 2-epimerase